MTPQNQHKNTYVDVDVTSPEEALQRHNLRLLRQNGYPLNKLKQTAKDRTGLEAERLN